jgi:hypothetical protein
MYIHEQNTICTFYIYQIASSDKNQVDDWKINGGNELMILATNMSQS